MRFHHSPVGRHIALYLSSSEMITMEYGRKSFTRGSFNHSYNFHIGIMIRGVFAKFGFSIINYRRKNK